MFFEAIVKFESDYSSSLSFSVKERQDDMQASKRIFFVHDRAFHIAVLLLCILFFLLV